MDLKMPSNEKHNELDKMADYSDQQAQDTLALRATYEELLQLQRDTGRWNMLYELSRSLALQQDLPTLLRLIIECASTLLNSSGGVLYLYNSQEHSLEVAAVKNFPFPVGTRLSWSNDGIEKLFESQRSGFLPILEAPMCFGGDQIGILAVSRTVNDEVDFTKEDERILYLFAGYAASAIRNLIFLPNPSLSWESCKRFSI